MENLADRGAALRCRTHVHFIPTRRNALCYSKSDHQTFGVWPAYCAIASASRCTLSPLFTAVWYTNANVFLLSTIVKRNELTPGIPVSDYEQRRRNLMELLPERSLVVSVAAPVKYMSGRKCHSVYFSSSNAYNVLDIL